MNREKSKHKREQGDSGKIKPSKKSLRVGIKEVSPSPTREAKAKSTGKARQSIERRKKDQSSRDGSSSPHESRRKESKRGHQRSRHEGDSDGDSDSSDSEQSTRTRKKDARDVSERRRKGKRVGESPDDSSRDRKKRADRDKQSDKSYQ